MGRGNLKAGDEMSSYGGCVAERVYGNPVPKTIWNAIDFNEEFEINTGPEVGISIDIRIDIHIDP